MEQTESFDDKKIDKTLNNCLLCGFSLIKTRKYCGIDNYETPCLTCKENFHQKCQKRLRSYCSKKCQANDPNLILSANIKRKELGYLSDNGQETMQLIREKYKVNNLSDIDFVKEKKKQKGKMGFARSEYKELIKEKYGVDNVSQLESVKQKKRISSLKRYGVDNVSKAPEVIRKIEETIMSKYGVSTPLVIPENQVKSAEQNPRRISKLNRKWQQKILDRTGVLFNFEQSFGTSEISYADLGWKNIRIDINPTITHNSSVSYVHIVGICKETDCVKKNHLARDILYHQNRVKNAENSNMKLLQLFDWYNESDFLDLIQTAVDENNCNISQNPDDSHIEKYSDKFLTDGLVIRDLSLNSSFFKLGYELVEILEPAPIYVKNTYIAAQFKNPNIIELPDIVHYLDERTISAKEVEEHYVEVYDAGRAIFKKDL